MSSINQLGRAYNLATSVAAAGVRVSLRDCSGVGFALVGATSGAATFSESNAATGGTTQALAAITEYWTQNNGVWTRVVQAAASTLTAATGGLAYVYINQGALSDGFSYLSASHGTGTFVYIMGDLDVQRWPSNLRDVRA